MTRRIKRGLVKTGVGVNRKLASGAILPNAFAILVAA
jgi:hypothetical protein